MKRILAILRRDALATTRDFILAYVLIAPLLLTLGTRFLLPAVGQTAVNVVVTEEIPGLAAFFHVEQVSDQAALERRVTAYDDVLGVVREGAGYRVITQGNENPEIPPLVATVLAQQAGSALPVAMEAVRENVTPYREIAGAIFAVSALLIAAIVMGLLIIDDKESRILLALGASPVSRREYVAARSLMAVALFLLLTFGLLWVLGLTQFNHLQVLAVALAAGGTSAALGFLIGALSANQIAGLATIKFLSLAVLAPPMAALALPERWQPVLWWTPTYWPFAGFRAILEGGTTWGGLLAPLAGSLLTMAVLAGALYPWLKNKLDFARN